MTEKIEFEATAELRGDGLGNWIACSGGKIHLVSGADKMLKIGQRYHVTLEPVEPELKPCPFCGEKDDLTVMRLGASFVRCLSCDAAGPIAYAHSEKTAEHRAIELWNHRA